MDDGLSPKAFEASRGTGDWRVLGEGACTYVHTGSFEVGVRLVAAIGALTPGDADRTPDIDLRRDAVVVRLITVTDDWYGPSRRDLELARRISGVISELGLTADPSRVQTVQLTIDSLVIPQVLPFWRAVLGYVDREDSPEDLVDALGRGPSVWFQEMTEPRPGRHRIHVDVWVPVDQAEARVAAALAAGGHLVSSAHAPGWWTLGDAEGNEVDVATWQDH